MHAIPLPVPRLDLPVNAVALPPRRNLVLPRPSALTAALLAAFVVMLAVVNPLSPSGPAKTDSVLQRLAAEHPNSMLAVIVRATVPGSRQAERLVERIGGPITHELPIIGGFSAQVPGS